MYYTYSPYLGPLLQTRSQKGTIAGLAGNKERDPTKRLLSRSTATTVVKRSGDFLSHLYFINVQLSKFIYLFLFLNRFSFNILVTFFLPHFSIYSII